MLRKKYVWAWIRTALLLTGLLCAASLPGQASSSRVLPPRVLKEIHSLPSSSLDTMMAEFQGGGSGSLRRAGSPSRGAVQATGERSAPNAHLLKDVNALTSQSANIRLMADYQGQLFFNDADPYSGPSLWRTDGSAEGTHLVRPGIGLTGSDSLVFKSILYFSGIEDIGSKLFRTDGTLAGTYAIESLESAGLNFEPDAFTALDDWLYMVNNGRLWRSDGSDHSLSQVSAEQYDLQGKPVVFNHRLYFTDRLTENDALWVYDPAAQQAHKFFDCRPDALRSNVKAWMAFNGWLYFTCDDGAHGNELWVTDGIQAHTRLYADLDLSGSSNPRDFSVYDNGLLFISTNSSEDATGVYWTAGMSAAKEPQELIPVLRGPASAQPAVPLGELDGKFLFFAPDETGQSTLWSLLDPRAAPQPILTAAPPTRFPYPDQDQVDARLYKQRYYFSSADKAYGQEVWVTDGTPAGTQLLADIWPGSEGSDPHAFEICPQRLCFDADDGVHGIELWSTDGTSAGTGLVEDRNLKAPNSWPTSISSSNGSVYFFATDGAHGFEPWRTDGTPDGTFLLKDIHPGKANGMDLTNFSPFVAFNGQTYFYADDGEHGVEPWVTDGTRAGTHLLNDLTPGPGSTSIACLVPAGDHLFVSTSINHPLYSVDQNNGVTAITSMTDDFDCNPDPTVFEDQLLFTRSSPAGETIWISDGTVEGTHPVLDDLLWQQPLYWTAAGHFAVIIGTTSAGTNGVWIADDTFRGAQRITGDDFHPTQVEHLVRIQEKVYFFAKEASSFNLYQVDPTRGEITLLEGFPGTAYVFRVFPFRDQLMFTVDTPSNQVALYKSNGTPGGTRQVAILPGFADHFTQAGTSLYFIEVDPSTGLLALWAWDGGMASPRVAFQTPEVNLLNSGLALTGSSVVFAADDFQSGYEPWVIGIEPVQNIFLPVVSR